MKDSEKPETVSTENEQTIVPDEAVQSTQTPDIKQDIPAKKRKLHITKRTLLVGLVILLAGGTAFALRTLDGTNGKSASTNPSLASKNTVTLTKDRAFVRYVANAAYEKDTDGKVKTITVEDGVQNNIRKKNFTLTVEKNGQKRDVTLDDKTTEFGATTDGTLYALSCTVPARGQVGANNASFTVQFYNGDGAKTQQTSWKQQDPGRPQALGNNATPGDYCYNESFNVNGSRAVDFTARGYGRENIDDLNYRVFFVKTDGTKQEVSRETSKYIDTPLGVTPDKTVLLYNRVSAKRTEQGCGPETQLPYKIPDYNGPINELHAYNLKTNTDTMVGTEKSFAAPSHDINISQPGYFSTDSGRYYLQEGNHAGCSGGDSRPIRIAYINLKTNKLETISSPVGKQYSDYCFTENGAFALEFGAVDDFNDKTPAKTPDAPTVLDTKDSNTYQASELTDGFDCYTGSLRNMFVFLNQKLTQHADAANNTNVLLGFSVFDPAKKTTQKITLKTPIDQATSSVASVSLTSDTNVGYINKSTVNGLLPTTLVDMVTGETQEVPYADFVL